MSRNQYLPTQQAKAFFLLENVDSTSGRFRVEMIEDDEALLLGRKCQGAISGRLQVVHKPFAQVEAI
jgi:hypothetical protein